jgi:hypothetical protein
MEEFKMNDESVTNQHSQQPVAGQSLSYDCGFDKVMRIDTPHEKKLSKSKGSSSSRGALAGVIQKMREMGRMG